MSYLKAFHRYYSLSEPYRTSQLLNRATVTFPLLAQSYNTLLWLRLRQLAATQHEPACYPAFLVGIPNYTTGIGHSIMELNTSFVISNKLGLTHLHVPLRAPWESFFGFGADELSLKDFLSKSNRHKTVRLPALNLSTPENLREEAYRLIRQVAQSSCAERPILFWLHPRSSCYEQSTTQNILIRKYAQAHNISPPTETLFNKRRPIDIAVHIRRGDIMKMRSQGNGPWRERYLNAEYFANLTRLVIKSLKNTPHRVTIYSQGSRSMFSTFTMLENINYQLDTCEQDTISKMIAADILICSPSSFSYVAALLSHGIKLFPTPFWHDIPTDSSWVPIDTVRPRCETTELNRIHQALQSHPAIKTLTQ